MQSTHPIQSSLQPDLERSQSSTCTLQNDQIKEQTISSYQVNFHLNDPENPKNWSIQKRILITIITSFSTLSVAYASSAYTGALIGMENEFNISEFIATLGLTLFVIGFATGPLLWAPLSEHYGRYPIYCISLFIYILLFIPAGLATNPQTILIVRFFGGIFGSSPLTNAGGTLSDIWGPEQRGKAMTAFAIAPFLGPVLGPITADLISFNIGWRWTFWVEMILSGIVWILMNIFVPETFAKVILRRRAANLRLKTGKLNYHAPGDLQGKPSLISVLKHRLSTPWSLLFCEPIVFLITIYMSFIYGILYLNFASFPIMFIQIYNFDNSIVGLSFIGVGIGILASNILEPWQTKIYKRAMMENDGIAPPEARLPGAFIGAIFIPISLLWIGLTATKSIHYIIPIIGSTFFGAGILLIFLPLVNYLVDAYLSHAASALAANTFVRAIFGAAFPLFTRHMFDHLGVRWANITLGLVSIILAPIPFLFYIYGAKIRSYSKFAFD